MEAEKFAQRLKEIGIDTITGIPDSTLQQFCDYVGSEGKNFFRYHVVPENEGAAVGLAIGAYLSTGSAACVYMQNSGLGNIVNPITSLAHRDVYGIPMLLLVGWRGEPDEKDEPQHRFMGRITLGLLDLMEIPYAIIDGNTRLGELDSILSRAQKCFQHKKQFAIVIKRGTFAKREMCVYRNANSLRRENAIRGIVKWLGNDDVIISTTGKISRELYEVMDEIKGNHKRAFLTVGGMGHAKMIAYGIAMRNGNRRVICLDGDGAVLMHMGGLAVMGTNPLDNLVHICLDNEAHESVGGMSTGAVGFDYGKFAGGCGYKNVYQAVSEQELTNVLNEVRDKKELVFIHVKIALGSRNALGRPKESPEDNKATFMEMMRAGQ